MEIFIALLIGLAAGMGSGLFGIGGGIIIVPLLILAFGFTQQKAQGTSLVALLLPVGLLAVKNYYDKQMIDFQKGGIIALGILLGAFFGSKLALELDELTMRRCFAGFLVIVAGYIAFKP
jgi:uncharacterized membrane protein YfcA